MADTLNRQRNRDWASDAPDEWQYVHLNILQDIRDELQALNRLLRCHNVRVGFSALEKIARRDNNLFKRRVEQATAKRIKRRGTA